MGGPEAFRALGINQSHVELRFWLAGCRINELLPHVWRWASCSTAFDPLDYRFIEIAIMVLVGKIWVFTRIFSFPEWDQFTRCLLSKLNHANHRCFLWKDLVNLAQPFLLYFGSYFYLFRCRKLKEWQVGFFECFLCELHVDWEPSHGVVRTPEPHFDLIKLCSRHYTIRTHTLSPVDLP